MKEEEVLAEGVVAAMAVCSEAADGKLAGCSRSPELGRLLTECDWVTPKICSTFLDRSSETIFSSLLSFRLTRTQRVKFFTVDH